jgi:hypothetical protein
MPVRKVPNLALRRVRELERQETRAEFADAITRKARELGESVAPTERYIAKLEDGEVRYPYPAYRRVLTALCGRSIAELGFTSPLAAKHGLRELALGAIPAPSESAVVRPSQDRRVIEALDVVGKDQISGIADSLGDLIDHYALTICALPPADAYDELLSVRSYASGIIERAGLAPRRNDLVLATGWLSNLLAVAACDMGEHATARVWCSDAERRSQDVKHPELAAWAVLTRAMIAFYQGQPRQSVMLASRGQTIAPIGTAIHAKLAAHEMRAAAMIGDAAHMTRARRYAAKAIAELLPGAKATGAFSINLGEDPPYTATSMLFVGNFNEAVSATNRVIQTIYQTETRQRGENPSGYARSLLILGLAQAGVGRLDEAVAAGHAALAGSRPAWPTKVLAGKLDQVLALDYADARETTEYHDRYLETASQPTGYHLQLPAPTEDR